MIVLLGLSVIENVDNQQRLNWGGTSQTTHLSRLSSLPFKYFCDSTLKEILFPTLIAACAFNPTNAEAISNDLNVELLSCYMRDKIAALAAPETSTSVVDLSARIPIELWEKLATWF